MQSHFLSNQCKHTSQSILAKSSRLFLYVDLLRLLPYFLYIRRKGQNYDGIHNKSRLCKGGSYTAPQDHDNEKEENSCQQVSSKRGSIEREDATHYSTVYYKSDLGINLRVIQISCDLRRVLVRCHIYPYSCTNKSDNSASQSGNLINTQIRSACRIAELPNSQRGPSSGELQGISYWLKYQKGFLNRGLLNGMHRQNT